MGKFRQSFNEREKVNLDGTEISFINYADLIKNKELNARPKDMEDIEKLKMIRSKKK